MVNKFAMNIEEEPLFYWECILSDNYAETCENMYNLSYILKEKVLKIWDSEFYNALVMIPDYDAIKESKFGPQGVAKNSSRLLYKTAKDEKMKFLKDLFEKETEAERSFDKQSLLDRNVHPGGTGIVCCWGHLTINIEEWEQMLTHFKESRLKVGQTWIKFFATADWRTKEIAECTGRISK